MSCCFVLCFAFSVFLALSPTLLSFHYMVPQESTACNYSSFCFCPHASASLAFTLTSFILTSSQAWRISPNLLSSRKSLRILPPCPDSPPPLVRDSLILDPIKTLPCLSLGLPQVSWICLYSCPHPPRRQATWEQKTCPNYLCVPST